MKTFGLTLLLVLLVGGVAFAQGPFFPYTSSPLPPGSIVVNQNAYGQQQILLYNGSSLQIVTPYAAQAAAGGFQMSGAPGLYGVDSRGFRVLGAPGLYPPDTRGTFYQYGGPVINIPISRQNQSNGNLFVSGQGYSPIPAGSIPIFNFGSTSGGGMVNQGGAYWASGGRR